MIRSILPTTLALALLCGHANSQQESATIQVLRGRAVVKDDAKSKTLLRSQEYSSDHALQLEIGAGSEADIRWPGVASLHIWGPSSLSWSFDDQGNVGWTFTDLAWADLEVRRGEHPLDLPGHWRTRVSASALHLRGLPSGPVELRHHAGPALKLEWRGDPSRVRPPVAVYAGSSLRLEPAEGSQESVQHHSGHGHSDDRTSALTRDLTPAPPAAVQVGTRSSRTTAPGDRARQPDFVQPRDIVVNKVPRVEPKAPVQNEAPRTAVVTPQPEPIAKPTPRTVPESRPTQVADSNDPWRGVLGSEMNRAGPLVIQQALGTEVRVTASGSWKVLVDGNAPGPVWCFGPKEDALIHPGGIVKYTADGELQLKFGKVEVAQAPGWRQPLEME